MDRAERVRGGPARLLLLAGAALLAPAALAANHGVPAAPGDRFTGSIDPVGDTDGFAIPLASGGRLTVQVRAATGSSLLPTLALRGPGGALADLTGKIRGEGGARLLMKDLPIADTGTWAVIVGGSGGTQGAYDVSFAAKAPLKAGTRGATVPEGGTADFSIVAAKGSLLSFILKEHGKKAVTGFEVLDPDGAVVPVPAGAVARHGRKVTG